MSFVSLSYLALLLAAVLWTSWSSAPKKHALLAFSIAYYCVAGPRDLALMFGLLFLAYVNARLMDGTEEKGTKKFILFAAVSITTTVLILCKSPSFVFSATDEGRGASGALPLGISFFGLQMMSYLVDVCRNRTSCRRNFFSLASYGMFFPQLICGPIERAEWLIPQLEKGSNSSYENLITGFERIVWGFFKKLVIANRIELITAGYFENTQVVHGPFVLLLVFLFTVQLYCDFSGYIDIAIGSARMLNINLSENFHFPLSSHSFRDFWKRWNTTVGDWFRDYLYIPLGGNKKGLLRTAQNIMAVFLVSGLWHGIGWNYVLWGFLHGCFLLIEMASGPLRSRLPLLGALWRLSVLPLVCLTFILFRIPNAWDALLFLRQTFDLSPAHLTLIDVSNMKHAMLALSAFFIVSLREKHFAHAAKMRNFGDMRIIWAPIIVVTLLTFQLGIFDNSQFFYFRF